ncbi:MAG: hypothetical protein KIPDCIKN_00631 [Haliscomenobacter sp.]|jgi:tetratricopeptide (TPR) repeat protein|nr:hypothetical protein [Haliscomenobacter sp.]
MKRYPFKFLDAYSPDDKDLFFGRDEEIAMLYEMVFQDDLLLLYGASGTGKTSLLQCGLATRFQSHEWLPLYIRRGDNFNESLNAALLGAAGEALDWIDEDLAFSAVSSTSSLNPLVRSLKAIHMRYFKPIYLIFDQLEELYILGSAGEQRAFIQTIQEIQRINQPVKIILSMREEYLGHLYEFERQVPELMRKKLRVEPMTQDRVTAVLLGVHASSSSNIHLKEGEEATLAEEIFKKIRGEEKTLSIDLPYLQVFLDKLYLQATGDFERQKDALFSLDHLQAIGDIGDVLRDFLDEQVLRIASNLDISPDEIWKTLSPFVTLEGTKEPLSSAMLIKRLPKLGEEFISKCVHAFQGSRILRFDERVERYEIAHDSLAKQIHAKRSDDEIALLEVQRLIKNQIAVKENAREFFTAKQLGFIEPFLAQFHPTPEELDWIATSQAQVQAEKDAEERKAHEELEKAKQQAEQERHLKEIALIAEREAIKSEKKAKRNLRITRIVAIAAMVFLLFAIVQMRYVRKAKTLLSQEIFETEIKTGLTYKLEGNYDKALDKLEKTLRLKNDLKKQQLDSLERFHVEWSAIQIFVLDAEKARVAGDLPTALNNYKNAYLASPDVYLYNAIESVQKDLDQTFNRYLQKGDALINLGKNEEALESYNKALRLKPNEDILLEKIKKASK